MSVILFDMNNLAIRCVNIKDVKHVDTKTKEVTYIDWVYWKLIMFNSIYMSLYNVKDAKTVVLAVDNRSSWRYEVWSRYKEDRKKNKNKDNFPWDEFFQKYEDFLDDIEAHLPFKVMRVDRAEGDDIIGALVLNKTNERFEIVSTDGDFSQLVSERCRLYNPVKRQHIHCPDTEFYLVEQCFVGQKKDSIFNIKTPDDWPEGKRKPGFGPKAFEKAVEYGWKDFLRDNKLLPHFKRNMELIDLRKIPHEIVNDVIDIYDNYKYPHPENIWKFVDDHKWPDIIENFTQIENKLLQLY